MLFGADELRELLEQFAAAQGLSARVEAGVLEGAVAEADDLAGGRAEDEAAAIFTALSRRSRALGLLARTGIPAIAHGFAIARGYHLAGDIELDILRARILYGAITFEELRAAFAAMRRPLARGPEPRGRKRPR